MAIPYNCQKASQPHSTIVKKAHSHTVQLSKFWKHVVKVWQLYCMAVNFFDNCTVWPWPFENIWKIVRQLHGSELFWQLYFVAVSFLTIVLCGCELFWQLYCMATGLTIYLTIVLCGCEAFWQLYGMAVSSEIFWQFYCFFSRFLVNFVMSPCLTDGKFSCKNH